MKVATVKEFKDKASKYLKDDEPIIVTRYGKVMGLYLPIDHPESFPFDMRKELISRLGAYVSHSLEKHGVSEKRLVEDFEAFKKTRRRR